MSPRGPAPNRWKADLKQPTPKPRSSAEAAPEPEAAQGEYNPLSPEAPLCPPPTPEPMAARRAELLAPAGGPEAAFAALQYGADAIYLGLKRFSARADAENFTLDELDEVTAYAHALEPRRRVLVAVNTLVLDDELDELVGTLGAVADLGADALLVQDLGVYRVARRYFPRLALHASTQLAVHNRAGVEVLRDLGFRRVVLARELTFEEVREIAAVPGIETEVFIHGALCYAYSGLCLLSAQTLARSGNRGRCAYACRDLFRGKGAPERLRDGTPVKRSPRSGMPFSMKDLALADFVPALRAAGVSSFKIEGRKKGALYVAAATAYYRAVLDGTLTPEERAAREADLQTVFSRPWTRLFVQSHRDKEVADRDTTGHRGARIGAVEAPVPADRRNAWVRFTTTRRLELHDGIQVDVPGADEPFGFAVEKLRRLAQPSPKGEAVFEAPAGARVEVALPAAHPELPMGAPVYCSSSQAVKQRYRVTRPKPGAYRVRRRAGFELRVAANALTLVARVLPRGADEAVVEASVTVKGEFAPAADASRLESAVRGALEKLGATRLAYGEVTLRNPEARFVPLSVLNQARREVAAALEAKLKVAQEARLRAIRAEELERPTAGSNASGDSRLAAAPAAVAPSAGPRAPLRWSLKVDRLSHLGAFEAADWEGLDEVTVEIARDRLAPLEGGLAKLAGAVGRERIRLALPILTRKWEEADVRDKVARLREAGWNRWEAANLSAWGFLNLRVGPDATEAAPAVELATDWPIYVVNRLAARQALDLGATRFTLSPEDGLRNVRALLKEFGPRAMVVVYQDTPQFLAESCAYANLIGGCPGKANCAFESMDLTSSYGEELFAVDYRCRTILVYRQPFCLAPFLKDLASAGAVAVRADFIYRPYAPEDVRRVWRLLRAGQPVPGTHTACFAKGMI